MKRVIVFLITLAILSPMLFNMGLGSAVFNTNPFNFFDENRRNMICGKQSSLSSPMPSKIIDGASSYIVTFYASVPLTVIHDAICKFEFRPLAFSEQRVFLLTLPPKSDFAKKNKNIIKSIEEDKIGYTFSEESLSNPNDDSNSDINLIQEISDVPNAMTLWELDSIGAYDAWKTTNGKPSTITAILDSGIDRSHPSFSGAIILDGYDATKKIPYTNTDESGHGTKVAGIIVANGKKGVSASGVAKQISILPIKISKNGIDILTSSLVDGLYFATDSGANVINMSFGGYDIVQAESDAINYAYKQGCILVAAAGNDGNSPIHAGKRSYPASYDGVISVASFAQGGIACGFSQYNDRVDISAPGERLTVLVMKNGKPTTIYENGTSFSAAYVSAAAALAVSISPQPINSDTFERLLEYSSSEKRDDYYGHGLLNIPELLKNVFYPVVFGVKDGNTYFDSVSAVFSNATALLDGEEYNSGELIFSHGNHLLTIKSSFGNRTISFFLDTIKLNYDYSEFDTYSVFTFKRGTATIDGFPYISGTRYFFEGTHEFVLQGINGNKIERTFTVSITPPQINGVSNGEVYNNFVSLTAIGIGKTFVNGIEFKNSAFITENGSYTVLSTNLSGTASQTIHFEIKDCGSTVFKKARAELVLVADETNGYLATYVRGETRVDIYKLNDLSSAIRSFNFKSPIISLTLDDTALNIAHRQGFTSLDRTKINEIQSPEIVAYETKNTFFCAAFLADNVWMIGEDGIFTVFNKKTSSSYQTKSIGTGITAAFADAKSNKIYCTNAETQNTLFIINALTGEAERKSIYNCSGNLIGFRNETLFFQNGAFSAKTLECIYQFSPTSRLLYLNTSLFITEDKIYDSVTGDLRGVYGVLLSSLFVAQNNIYIAFSDGKIVRLPKNRENEKSEKYFGASKPVSVFGKPYLSGIYSDVLPISNESEIVSIQYRESNKCLYVLLKDSKTLYVLDSKTLEIASVIDLKYNPSEIIVSNDEVYVRFFDANSIYACESGYLNLDFSPQKLAANTNFLFFMANGNLYKYDKTTKTSPVVILKNIAAEDIAASENMLYICGVFDISAFEAGSLSFVASADIAFGNGVNYYNDKLIVGSYVLDPLTLEFITTSGSVILSAAGNAVITHNGIFAISSESYISSVDADCDRLVMNRNCDVYMCLKGGICRIRSDSNDITAPAIITGVSNDISIKHSTVITFNKGNAFLDNHPFLSGETVTEGGSHSLLVVLPWGIRQQINFTVISQATSILAKLPSRTISLGESVAVAVTLLPKGSVASIRFSCEGDAVSISNDGIVTARNVGTATIIVKIKDTDISVRIAITVSDDILSCSDENYKINNSDCIISCISEKTSVTDFLSKFSFEHGNIELLDHNGNKISNGIVTTNCVLNILSKTGENLMRYTVSVKGDLDFDGAITINDADILYQNLRSEVHFTEPLFSAADYNMNGQITSNDLKLLNKLVAPTFYDENPIFSGLDMRLPNFAYHDGIFSATILKGNISGITSLRGILEYDSNTLEFSNGEFYSGAAFVEKLSDGKIAYTLLGLENENNDPRLLKLSFQVKSTAENTKFSLKEANIYKDGLYSPKNTEFSIDLRSNPTEMLKISSPSSTLDFDEKTTNYSIEVLDTEQYFDIDVSCPINGAVYYSHHELNEKLTTFKLIYEPFGAAPITYTFSINKVEHLSLPESNAYLKTLSLGKIELSPIFSSFVFFYTTKVDSKTVRVSLDYKPQADTTIIEIQGSTILSYGENIINIICTAANGNKIIYTIAITRPEPVISIDPNPNPSQNESETSPPQSSNESDAQSDNSTVQTPTNHKTLIILGCTLPFVCIAVVLFITAKRRKK